MNKWSFADSYLIGGRWNKKPFLIYVGKVSEYRFSSRLLQLRLTNARQRDVSVGQWQMSWRRSRGVPRLPGRPYFFSWSSGRLGSFLAYCKKCGIRVSRCAPLRNFGEITKKKVCDAARYLRVPPRVIIVSRKCEWENTVIEGGKKAKKKMAKRSNNSLGRRSYGGKPYDANNVSTLFFFYPGKRTSRDRLAIRHALSLSLFLSHAFTLGFPLPPLLLVLFLFRTTRFVNGWSSARASFQK